MIIHGSDRSNSIDDPLARGQRAVETVKIIVGMQIDDATFRNQLLESGVLSTKDFTKWTFEILFELFEGGPLLNPRRLDEAMRATKFMKRLLGFYQPYNYRYSSLRKTHVRLSSLSSFHFY
jgi:rapamycin-insensitive companion of mTOR